MRYDALYLDHARWILAAGLVLAAPGCGTQNGETSPTGATATEGSSSDTTTETSSTSEGETTGETTGEPACCGCLCVDSAWSCGANTCTPEGGGPALLGPEAGFLEIAEHPIQVFIGSDLVEGQAPPSRLWYSFRPADTAPETRPLAVFFNGGPGFSSLTLFASNTGPVTLDPEVAGDAAVVANPHTWSRFANLLYIDPAETGFSYNIALADGTKPSLPFIPEHDAALMVQGVLAFLARHPAIEGNQVILVGESWGGVRAALMGQQLLFSGELLDAPMYRSAQLHAAVVDHLARVFPGLPADDPATAAAQFGHRVLVQPSITYANIENAGVPFTPPDEAGALLGCIDDFDFFQCDEPLGWTEARGDAVLANFVDPVILNQALGVEAETIAWMYADARTTAYSRGSLTPEQSADQAALARIFGAVGKDDPYYLNYFARSPLPATFYNAHPGYARLFVRTLPYVRTFVTHAAKDTVVYSLDLPSQLAWHGDLVAAATHDPAPVGDEARPGRILVEFTPESGLAELQHTIRFPYYEGAGHMVTARAAAEIAADVEAWLAEP